MMRAAAESRRMRAGVRVAAVSAALFSSSPGASAFVAAPPSLHARAALAHYAPPMMMSQGRQHADGGMQIDSTTLRHEAGGKGRAQPMASWILPPKQIGTLSAAAAAAVTSFPSQAAADGAVEVAQSVAAPGMDAAMVEIGVFLAKTVISWGVPAAVIGLLIVKIITSFKGPGDGKDPLDDGPPMGPAFFGMMKRKPGEPVEMLKIERLNDRLDSFEYSLEKLDKGRRGALLDKRRKDFERAYGMVVTHLTDKQLALLLSGDQRFRTRDEQILQQIESTTQELRALAANRPAPIADGEYKGANETDSEEGTAGFMQNFMGNRKVNQLQKQLTKLLASRVSNEMQYISGVSALLGKNERQKLELILKSRRHGPVYTEGETALSLRTGDAAPLAEAKHVFVLDFPGDVSASQVAGLREEVTALSRYANASRGDEVVLLLNTGGGTVTGYGLAAAQLMRIKALGLKLHICVEQVAASGGYMMACCADKITASPFAVIGSIGVISDIPNVYERLNKEGIEFLTVTAGKYKRTLTPTKKPDPDDFKKTKADIEQVLVLFKEWVKTQRPQLDIDSVATGETWFGPDALERNLVDELITSDDVLLQKISEGAEIFSIKYQEPKKSPIGALLPAGASPADALAAYAWQWFLGRAPQGVGALDVMRRSVNVDATEAEEQRYMAVDPLRADETTRF